MIPHRTVIECLVKSSQMRQLVYEGLETVMPGVAAYQDRFTLPESNAAHRFAMHPLDDCFANKVNLPARRHWLLPYP